jgi:nickel-type superoxide dismutase maturation protease
MAARRPAPRRPLRTRVALAAVAIELTAATTWLGLRTARRLARSWSARVAVEGGSMQPTLQPGDWLLVDPQAYRSRAPRRGDLVLAADPREPARLLVKRVSVVEPDGQIRVSGDAPAASTDSRVFGSLDPAAIEGRPWFRYWPPSRAGRVR